MTLQEQITQLEAQKKTLETECAPLYAKLMEIQQVERKALNEWCVVHDQLKCVTTRLQVARLMQDEFGKAKEQNGTTQSNS